MRSFAMSCAGLPLACPWLDFDLDGRLLFARDMGPDFDPAKFPLKQAHCQTLGGYVYVCLADKAPDFNAFARMLEPCMLPHGLKDAKVAHTQTLIEKANWKLVTENNRECYHCSGSHPELLRTLSEYDSTDDPRVPKVFADRIRASGPAGIFSIALHPTCGATTRKALPLIRLTHLPACTDGVRSRQSISLHGKACGATG